MEKNSLNFAYFVIKVHLRGLDVVMLTYKDRMRQILCYYKSFYIKRLQQIDT